MITAIPSAALRTGLAIPIDGEGTWLPLPKGEGWGEVVCISFSRSQY